MHRVIRFNQKAWLNTYVGMIAKLRKETKNYYEKNFFKIIDNAVFGKTIENIRKHRNIRLVTTEQKRSYLVSQPNHPTKWF